MLKMKFWALSLAFLVFVGCSGNVKSGGTVVFSDDGSPVPCGTICFATDTFLARGDIVDGKFTLGSESEKDGLPPGEYRVYFSAVEEAIDEGEADENGVKPEPTYVSLIDLKYLSADTSGLTQKIDGSTKNSLEFKLDRNPDFPE